MIYYYVYILHCSDGSYYTGVTNNLDRRFNEHQSGIDEKCYTYKRRPLTLAYSEPYLDVNQAIAREKQIKRWSRIKKMALIDQDVTALRVHAANKINRDRLNQQ